MRQISIALLLLAASLTAQGKDKDREWKDAVFVGTVSGSGGAAAMPIGGMIVAVPLTRTFYIVKMDHVTYSLRTSSRPNLTVNGKIKFALDGHNAHILDEDNKDRKFSIVEKVADKTD